MKKVESAIKIDKTNERLIGLFAPSPIPVVEVSLPPEAEPTIEKKSGPFNMFNGLFSSSSKADKPKALSNAAKPITSAQVPVVKVPAAKAPVVKASTSMNAEFQQAISKKLKNDKRKIQAFQKATDSYRGGSLKPEKFLNEIESLFGPDEVDAIIGPLCSELPEADKSKVLKSTYQREYKRSSDKAKSGGAFGGLFGGKSGKSEEPKAASIAPQTTPAAKKIARKMTSVPSPSTRKLPKGSAAKRNAPVGRAVAVGKVKVPVSVPVGKQVVVGQRIQSFQGGSLSARDFYNFLVKTLGKQTVAAVLPDICSALTPPKARELQQCANSAK